MVNFLRSKNLLDSVRSLSVVIEAAEDGPDYFRNPDVRVEDFWPSVSVLPNMRRLNMVAQPSVLRQLLSLRHTPGPYYNTTSCYHLLSLSRASGPLQNITFDWDHVLLNEGSSVFLENRDPSNDSDLQRILHWEADQRRPPSILMNTYPPSLRRTRKFTYTALFAWEPHLQRVVDQISQNAQCICLRVFPTRDDPIDSVLRDQNKDAVSMYVGSLAAQFFIKLTWSKWYVLHPNLKRLECLDLHLAPVRRRWRTSAENQARGTGNWTEGWDERVEGGIGILTRKTSVPHST